MDEKLEKMMYLVLGALYVNTMYSSVIFSALNKTAKLTPEEMKAAVAEAGQNIPDQAAKLVEIVSKL